MNWILLVEDYLKQRRQMGYQLLIEGQQLLNFARYAERKKAKLPLTVALARNWGSSAPSGSPIAMARRVSLLRPFSQYLNSLDPTQVILPTRLMGPTHRRLPPFIYSKEDITGLMTACDSLFSIVGLRPHTLRTLIGLLVSTGLRPGEAVRLKQHEVKLPEKVLAINSSKGWKHRIVPVTTSTVAALQVYQRRRDQLVPCKTTDAFFVSDYGQPLSIFAADYAFGLIRTHQGLSHQNNGRRPRLYDMRHTFVCHRLLAWYEANENIDGLMPLLSQYIGHKKVSDTYHYIQSIPALMNRAAYLFEHHQRTTRGKM